MHTCVICGKTTEIESEFTIIAVNGKEEAYCPDHTEEALKRIDDIFDIIAKMMDRSK